MVRKSFCRICTAVCGIDVDVDGEKVLSVRGDVDHPLSRGYTCSKGRALPQMHHRDDRLLHPQMREAGALRRAGWDEVLDDLASRLRAIIDESDDALTAGFGDGDSAIVRSPHGQLEGRITLDPSLRSGVLTVPHGWHGRDNVNQLTGTDDVDPLTGMTRFSNLPVQLIRTRSARPTTG